MSEQQNCKQGGQLSHGPDGYAACKFEGGSEITVSTPGCHPDYNGYGFDTLIGCMDYASQDVMGRMDNGKFAAYQICGSNDWHKAKSGKGWTKYYCRHSWE